MTDTAELKPVAWRARRYGSSEWEVFGYDPRALKQFSFFEPLYSADALSSLVREMDEAKSIAASAQANVFRLVAAGRDDLELMKETAATVQSLIARATAAEANAARMREALKPFADFAPYVEMFVEGRAAFGGSNTLPTKHFRKSDFVRARNALGGKDE